MTTLDLYQSTAGASAEGKRSWGSVLKSLWRRYQAHRKNRQIVYALASLDDRILRDIGIEPQDVIAALNGQRAPSIQFNPMRRNPDHE